MADRAALLTELIAAHEAVYDGVLAAVADLDDADWTRPTGCPGWDVRAQLAHVIGIERMVLGEAPPADEVPDAPHLRNDFGRLIERDVVLRAGRTPDELRAEAREVFDRRLEVLRATTPGELDEEVDTLLGRRRLVSFLRTRLFDMVSHERDVRAAVDRLHGFDGPHVPVGVEQVLHAWARTLPAKVDRSGTVCFEVAGGPVVALDLATGTLRRDVDATAEVDATIRLTAAQVLALGGGRDDAPTTGDLEVTGDLGLATTAVAAAAVTP
ncbi:maleylpyruvate isomerase family mycothiol-dependent enzyme [Nitriliruptoraceae bacterium ZYF776]|nr:maleylpyruvate isomerase family mycothiol-dependent enzyme [Profundirhabdus halotolerans]